VKKGDIIQGMNGKRIDSIEELQDVLRQKQPGDKVALTILRDLRQIRVEVTLEKMP
jgi:S1-C subfamily serine protease